MSVEEVRKKMGLSPGQLLRNPSGFTGDLLTVEGEFAIIGVLETGKTQKVPLSKLLTAEKGKSITET